MTDPRPTRALLRCDGAAVPAELARQRWDVREDVTAAGGDPDLTLVVDNLVGKVAGAIAPRVLDLIRLAAYCFAADQAVRRGGRVDVHREGWRRELVLCVPVADPAFWSAPDVAERLVRALGFGTDDRWAFAFDRAGAATAQVPIRWAPPPPDRPPGAAFFAAPPEAVVLVSGGTDSLCALVEALRDRPTPPVVVSHWPARHVKARQDRLVLDVQRRFGRFDVPHVSFEIHRAGGGDGDSAQRTRGFLFGCLGAAVAAHVGAGEVLLADNGYVSLNPPVNGQLVAALASRGTHPKFLHLLNRLLERVFDGAVRVVNPLRDRTRAEALGILTDAGCPELLGLAYSCGKHRTRERGKTHCGGCSQCVDRRVAVVRAGLEAFDPPDRYDVDLFRDALPEGEARTVALSYFRFADEVAKTEAAWLYDAYPELDACLDPDDPDFRAQSVAIPDLLKRHAEEALAVLGAMFGRHQQALARRELPAHALLNLWRGDGGGTPTGAKAETYGVEAAAPRNRLERSGPVWLAEFRGEKGGLTDLVGTRRLARLLKASGQELEALDLVAGSSPPTAVRRDGRGRAAPGPDAAPWRASGPRDAGAVLDDKAVRAYRAHVKELDARIAASGDAPEATRLRREREWVREQLRAGLGRDGRPRGAPEEHERARSTVSKTVHQQIDLLATAMPLLHAHLTRWVHLGYLCWYAPEPPEEWDVPA